MTFKKLFWFKNILLAGIFGSLLMSEKLWLTARSYPIVPLVPGLPSFPYPLDHVFFYAILAAIVGAIFCWKKPRPFLIAAAAGLGILVLMDITRLQPEFYEYFFLLVSLCLFSWDQKDTEGREAVILICQTIIIFVYFWSGLQKYNPSFIDVVFPFILHPLAKFVSYPTMATLLSFASLAPFAETLAGIGLLTRQFRNAAVIFAIAMHLFILYSIGPFGNNWNNIIWPWQILMIFFVWLLFWNNTNSWKDIFGFSVIKNVVTKKTISAIAVFYGIVIILFGIMPLFSFFGRWDENLSFALYTGNTSSATFYIGNNLLYNLPDEIQNYAVPSGPGMSSISNLIWSLAVLDVPPYPETRVYRAILNQLCVASGAEKSATSTPTIKLVINSGQPVIGKMAAPMTYTCQ